MNSRAQELIPTGALGFRKMERVGEQRHEDARLAAVLEAQFVAGEWFTRVS
jgi:hypothetical protein